MTEIVAEERALPASKKVMNVATLTIIPNSRAEHSVYTYSTKVDTYFDIKDPDFFNPGYTCLAVGDIIRIFKFDQEELTNYLEFIVTKVDKLLKTVSATVLFEKTLKVKKEKIGDK
jgi:hypothetical protein